MVSDLDLGWLGGLFDGEGSISTQREGRNYPRVDIVNTDKALLEKAQAILDALEIDNSLRLRASTHSPKHSPVYQLTIGGSSGIKKFFAQVPVQSKAKLDKFHSFEHLLSNRPYSHTRARSQRLARQYPTLV